jgi:hypothetical protein
MKTVWVLARDSFDKWRKEIDLDDYISGEELYGTGFEAGFREAKERLSKWIPENMRAKAMRSVSDSSGQRRIIKGYYMISVGVEAGYCDGSKYHLVHEQTATCEKCKTSFLKFKRQPAYSNE